MHALLAKTDNKTREAYSARLLSHLARLGSINSLIVGICAATHWQAYCQQPWLRTQRTGDSKRWCHQGVEASGPGAFRKHVSIVLQCCASEQEPCAFRVMCCCSQSCSIKWHATHLAEK